MSRVTFAAIALRREIINSKGKRLELKKSGWQRCFMQIDGDLLRIWNAGGILLENIDALEDLQTTSEPIDSVHLRLVHIQRIPDKNSLCLHFTDGMERILLMPESEDNGRTVETWMSTFQRVIRDTILLDQYNTSIFLHTYKSDEVLSFAHMSPKGIFDESFSVEFKWSGATEFQRCDLSIKMKPGWKDSRVVSKRCISLSREDDLKKQSFASISSITSLHLLSESEGTFVLEGDGKYLLNDPQIAPITERILMKPLQIDELKKLLLFLRDAFEIILPRPNIFDESESNVQFQRISTEDSEKEKNGKGGSFSASSQPFILSSLIQSKPWNQLPWNDLYTFYKLKNFKNQCLSSLEFTRKFKEFGFCLKSVNGSVVTSPELQRISEENKAEEELKALFAQMYWHHIALNIEK